MLTRVATFASAGGMLSAALKTQAQLAQDQVQQASGEISADYGGLGTGATRLLNLQVAVARSTSYSDAATLAASRGTAMSDALASMSDVLTQFRAALTQASGSTGGVPLLATQAQGLLQEFAAQLNTRYEGRYLFAGSQTQTEPVDLSALGTATDLATPDTAYYKGNADVASVRVGADQTISYGITAGDSAFEQAIRVLQGFSQMSASDVTGATITAGAARVETALDAVLAVRGKLSVDTGTMQRAAANEQSFQDYASSLSTSLSGVDVASVTAQMSTYETQLQASYAAIAKIGSLRLLDYLK